MRGQRYAEEVVETRLGCIEYCTIGKGTPVLFLHGGHSNCNERLCLKGFDREKYQLIIPSRPGYGRTPLGNNRTPREAAALIAELIKYLGLESVVLYAISAGGTDRDCLCGFLPRDDQKTDSGFCRYKGMAEQKRRDVSRCQPDVPSGHPGLQLGNDTCDELPIPLHHRETI